MKKLSSPYAKHILKILPFNLFMWVLLFLYLSPIFFMVTMAMMPTEQLGNKSAPLYPAKITQIDYQGKQYQLYHVPLEDGDKVMALIEPKPGASMLLDPQRPESGLVEWQGDWRTLTGVYEFHIEWSNFTRLFEALPIPQMVSNTFFLIIIGEIGVLCSSILAAYGFARFSLPGGNFLFYLLIATILIPEKITFIPTFYMYIRVLNWRGTVFPMLIHLFFGNAVFIFLLRQNFRSLPIEIEEAAMLDGAGPLRRLISVILPQSWPVVITVAMLHLFYTWNETRLSSLYLGSNSAFLPISFAVQNYQSLIRIDNLIEAATVIVLFVPVVILFLAQRYFLQGLVITGAENRQ